jgi:hypothetical protein
MRVIIFGESSSVSQASAVLRAQGIETFVRSEFSTSLVKTLKPSMVVVLGRGPAEEAFCWSLQRSGSAPRIVRQLSELQSLSQVA